MTQEQIERRVAAVLRAQEAMKKLKAMGLIKANYRPILDSALNTAMRLTREGTAGNSPN